MSSSKLNAPSQALSPRRIARSLTTVLVLTFLQVIAGPVVLPHYATSPAEATTLYGNVSDWQQWTNWQTTTSNHTPYATSAGTTPISSNADTMNLTQNVNMQDGSIWNTKTFSFSNDFSVSANYYFGNTNGGADGIYFYMKPLGRWPNGGTAGAANGTAVSNAGGYISLFFDTYQNGNELANDHLTVYAVKSDGSSTVYTRPNGTTGVPLKNSSGTELTDVENDVFYPFTIVWRASARTLSVYGGASANYQFYSTVITTGEMDGTNFSFGWQGITGGANNYQAINNVQYHLPATITSNPTNVTVNSGETATVTAAYTTAEGSATTYWQFSDDGGAFWNNTGATTTSYSFPTSRSISGRKYRFYVETTAFGTTHSTVSNPMTLFVNAPPPTGLNDDYAISLNGSSQYVSAGDDNAFDIANAITLEAWVKPTALPGNSSWKLVINKAANYELGMMSTGGRTYWAYGLQSNATTGWLGESTTVAVALNEWHHIAITREASSSTVKFYYDGNLAYIGSADVAGTGSLNNSAYPLVIGARYNNVLGYAETFTGLIDQVAIFGVARLEEQIKSDMHNYLPGNTTGLQAYYDFNEGSGTTIYNRVVGTTLSTDLATAGSPSFSSIIETSTVGPYSFVKFPRTVLNSGGGWKFSGEIRTASVLVLGGGGAGGGGYQGGGGGAGGFIETRTTLTTIAPYAIKVGAGGKGASNPIAPTGGDTSTAFGFNALGGGRGASEWDNTNDGGANYFNVVHGATSGGSGGGGAWGSGTNTTPGNGTPGQGNSGGGGGGISDPINFAGGGGGGAGSAGETATSLWYYGGNGGSGVLSLVLNQRVAGGGGGASRYSTTQARAGVAVDGGGNGAWDNNKWPTETGGGQNGTANTGGGGGGSASNLGFMQGRSGFGGSGIVAIRWITASKPTYTKLTNTTLDVGQTETFTVNVASDSATVMLTRTFKWESTTAGTGGTFTKIKEGTGADNSFFAWVPSDTSTSGSSYLYRLTVTDSDTAGLFITDSSTAYATINGAMVIVGNRTVSKTINVVKSESFTITLGTPTFKATLTNINPGISLDTSTAGIAVIKVADTMTVGTYYETLTVVDSVSASVTTPLTIRVSAPPTMLNTTSTIDDSLVLHLEPGNSASYTPGVNAIRDISGSNKQITINGTPTYSSDNLGVLAMDATLDHRMTLSGFPQMTTWTVEAFIRVDTTLAGGTCIISNTYSSSQKAMNFALCVDASRTVYAGYHTTNWNYARTTETLTVGAWTQVSAVYDGSNIIVYFNGVNKAQNTANGSGTTTPPASATNSIIIGEYFEALYPFNLPMTMGYVKLFKRGLSPSEILADYNATKSRFETPKINYLKPSQKYGNLTSETFTVTSGSDTKTVSYAVGNRAGLTWLIPSDSNQINLAVQESLSVGSYYDTVTVTDTLGSSTYLPIKMTISKADTLTISMDSATAIIYNGSPLTSYPKPYFKGLVGVDTLTVSTKFSSLTYQETTTVPTNADTYTVKAADPVFSIGAASNYVNIVYETSTATINKAVQRPLNVALYGGVVGSPFLILLQGGSGDGAVTETLTGVATLSGCAINNHFLTASEQKQGFCEVRVVKASSQNYLAETQTVQMYFMAFENNQPTGQVGSGSTIALNGVTSFNVDPTAPPTITALSATTISLAGLGTFVITGTGFGTGGLVVKFYRNKTLAPASATATSITFNVADMSSVLGSSGRVTVITNNGQTLSADSVTVNP